MQKSPHTATPHIARGLEFQVPCNVTTAVFHVGLVLSAVNYGMYRPDANYFISDTGEHQSITTLHSLLLEGSEVCLEIFQH